VRDGAQLLEAATMLRPAAWPVT